MLLGPIFKSRCSECGNRWRISRWSIVVSLASMAAIPIVFVWGVTKLVLSPTGGSFLLVAVMVVIVAATLMVHVVPVRKG